MPTRTIAGVMSSSQQCVCVYNLNSRRFVECCHGGAVGFPYIESAHALFMPGPQVQTVRSQFLGSPRKPLRAVVEA
jgi:hypothetical protein